MVLSSTTREKILSKTNGHCFYCNQKLRANFHIDHFISKYRWKDWGLSDHLGSVDQLENLFPACPRCNMKKGAQDPEDFMGNSFLAHYRTARANFRVGLVAKDVLDYILQSHRYKESYQPLKYLGEVMEELDEKSFDEFLAAL